MSKATFSRSPRGKYHLRLYVADGTPQSILAIRNLKELCEQHLAGRYQIEVVDLLKNPWLAQQDNVLVVPTLVRTVPSPIRKFIGSLSHPERVLIDFDLNEGAAEPDDEENEAPGER